MQEVQLFRSGIYGFFITGIVYKNKDGEHLKRKDGNQYEKIKISVVDAYGYSKYIYVPVFGSEIINQILKSIGNQELMQKFKEEKFKSKDLIGAGGYCLVGIQRKEGYPPENNIDCYIHNECQYLVQKLCVSIRQKDASPEENVLLENGETAFSDHIPF